MQNLNWYQALAECKGRGEALVLATLLTSAGSTPRDTDAKMVITASEQYDTLGGGRLEFEIINTARQMLLQGETGHRIERYALGTHLGQCCGGNVSVLLEGFTATRFQVAVFGAGHVAQALIPILGGLPCQVHWIDNRPDLFPEHCPANIRRLPAVDPAGWVARLPAGADLLILTHDHSLDFDITAAALQRNDFRLIGLIGSRTKANRFRHRLEKLGLDPSRLTCPVGLAEVPGKLPMEVAVSMAAQLIALEHGQGSTGIQQRLKAADLRELVDEPSR